MVQEKNLEKKSEKDAQTVKKKKKIEDYQKSHPYGFGRYVNISKQTFYLHTEAYIHIAGLCRRSGLPKDIWPRIETTFLNSHGLSKHPKGIIVQEEIIPDPETQLMVKGGLSELLEDYVGCLDEELKEKENKVIKLIVKWEKIAKELQKEFKSKANIGEDFDHSGRKRIKEDISENPVEWKG